MSTVCEDSFRPKNAEIDGRQHFSKWAAARSCRNARQVKSNTRCCKDPLPRVAFQTDCYCISIHVVVLVAFWHLWGMRPYPQSLLG